MSSRRLAAPRRDIAGNRDPWAVLRGARGRDRALRLPVIRLRPRAFGASRRPTVPRPSRSRPAQTAPSSLLRLPGLRPIAGAGGRALQGRQGRDYDEDDSRPGEGRKGGNNQDRPPPTCCGRRWLAMRSWIVVILRLRPTIGVMFPALLFPVSAKSFARHRNPIGIAANSTVTTTANTAPHGSTSSSRQPSHASPYPLRHPERCGAAFRRSG